MTRLTVLVYCVMGLTTFAVYALDKIHARRGGRRTPEITLHLLALLCGVGGAVLAQAILRHKTRKGRFRLVTLGIALVHSGFWLWWAFT